MTTNPERIQTDYRTSTEGVPGTYRQTWNEPDPMALSTHAYHVIRRLQAADGATGWKYRGFYALMLATGGCTPGELAQVITELTNAGLLEEGK